MLTIIIFICLLGFMTFLAYNAKGKYLEELKEADVKTYAMKKILPIGLFLLDKLRLNYNLPYAKRLKAKMEELYGSSKVVLHTRLFIANKICAVLLSVIIILFFGSLMWIQDYSQFNKNSEAVLKNNSILERPEYGGGSKSVALNVNITAGDTSENFQYNVTVRELPPKSDKAAVEKAYELLDEGLIKGRNKSLENISEPLALKESYPTIAYLGTNIKWVSSNTELIAVDGQVNIEKIEKDSERVKITAVISKNNEVIEKVFTAAVLGKNHEEALIAKAKDEIDNQVSAINNQTNNEKTIALPVEIKDDKNIKIDWDTSSQKKPNWELAGVNAVLLAAFVIAVLWFLLDKDINAQIDKRRKSMQYEFPTFLTKLLLMINAGVNLNSVWTRIIESRKSSPLYIELRRTALEISNGMPEQQAYERFAYRCRLPEITKFVSLIIQNKKKGNGELVQLLGLLSRECWEIRKNTARQLGEEASTKMMLPMAIILIGILIIVSAPAFLALNGF